MSAEPVNEVKIKLAGANGSIEVDGHQLGNAVVRVEVSGRVGAPPEVHLTMLPRKAIEVDAEAVVRIDADTSAALQALGWTPPPWAR